jgi:hypothetical protein
LGISYYKDARARYEVLKQRAGANRVGEGRRRTKCRSVGGAPSQRKTGRAPGTVAPGATSLRKEGGGSRGARVISMPASASTGCPDLPRHVSVVKQAERTP